MCSPSGGLCKAWKEGLFRRDGCVGRPADAEERRHLRRIGGDPVIASLTIDNGETRARSMSLASIRRTTLLGLTPRTPSPRPNGGALASLIPGPSRCRPRRGLALPVRPGTRHQQDGGFPALSFRVDRSSRAPLASRDWARTAARSDPKFRSPPHDDPYSASLWRDSIGHDTSNSRLLNRTMEVVPPDNQRTSIDTLRAERLSGACAQGISGRTWDVRARSCPAPLPGLPPARRSFVGRSCTFALKGKVVRGNAARRLG